jgi:hypothetical protein
MPEPRQYALVVARWPAGEWVAAVVEDEAGLRVVHLHHAGCADGSCGVDTARVGWTVAEAIALAEQKRDEMLAASLPFWGPPQSVDTFLETTGDGERLEARIGGPQPAPGPAAGAADGGPGTVGAAALLAFMGFNAAMKLPARVTVAIAGLAVVAVALIGLVALVRMLRQDHEVVRIWQGALAEADERHSERVTKAARRLRATGRPAPPRLAA